MSSSKKPILAILTEAIRFDNQDALKYFSEIQPVHFYESAPYGDLKEEELKNAIKYEGLTDLEQKLLELKPNMIQGAEPYASRKALKLCLVAKKISKKLNIPLIFPMLENKTAEARFGIITAFFMKKILKSYAQASSLIFALNNGAIRNLHQVGISDSKIIKLLYGIWGVETDIFKPLSTNYHLSSTILVLGRLDEAKGLPYVVEAWKSIEQEYPNISIHFAGKGELAHLIDGQRMTHGFVKNSDLPKLINESLFTITASITQPRWEEQVGMTNLQALSCGVPVITTKSGAIPEYVTSEVGILVPEKDSKAIAQAMRKLLDDETLRTEMGQKARQYILDHFDAQKTVEKVEKILLNLL